MGVSRKAVNKKHFNNKSLVSVLERAQPKSVKPKNERAQIKKRCTLVRGVKAKRRKINGSKTRPGCTYSCETIFVSISPESSNFPSKSFHSLRKRVHLIYTYVSCSSGVGMLVRFHDVPNSFYIVYSVHYRWLIHDTKPTKSTKLLLIRFDPHGTTIKQTKAIPHKTKLATFIHR